jgi:hypothetical protein
MRAVKPVRDHAEVGEFWFNLIMPGVPGVGHNPLGIIRMLLKPGRLYYSTLQDTM